MPGAFEEDSLLTTPHTTGRRPAPSHGEMHPSKVHHSTKKAPDSGLRFGFVDIKEHEKAVQQGVNSSPSKPKRPPSSAGFDFKWAHQESDLSSEAQRIMDGVREEAERIKSQMQLEREEQARKDEAADQMANVGQRRIAKAKGKSGRFSEVHREEFKKMDSIANHASVWKAKYAQPTAASGLKRSQSKADIGDTSKGNGGSDRLEDTSPGKRMKAKANDDVSHAREAGENGETIKSPSRPNDLPQGITTPTKASLARAASVKSTKFTKIPALTQSKSVKDMRGPAGKNDDGLGPTSPLRKATSLKSILVKPQPKYSDDPLKIAAGTHLPFPKDTPTPEPRQESATPSPSKLPATASPKRVDFTASTHGAALAAIATAAPTAPASPSKIPSLCGTPAMPPPDPSSPSKTPSKTVAYPVLHHPPTPMPVARPLASHPPTPPAPAPVLGPAPPQQCAFNFTAPSTAFERPVLKPVGPASPSRIARLPTIRQVRPSGVPTPMSSSGLPAVPHGFFNKKRRRPESDDEGPEGKSMTAVMGNEENCPPAKEEEGSPAKKVKMGDEGVAKDEKAKPEPAPERRRLFKGKSSASGAPKERKGLSLSRLNMLARPKSRR